MVSSPAHRRQAVIVPRRPSGCGGSADLGQQLGHSRIYSTSVMEPSRSAAAGQSASPVHVAVLLAGDGFPASAGRYTIRFTVRPYSSTSMNSCPCRACRPCQPCAWSRIDHPDLFAATANGALHSGAPNGGRRAVINSSPHRWQIPTTAGQTDGQSVCLCIDRARGERPHMPHSAC